MQKITKYFKATVKSFDAETHTAEVVISDETTDRYEERVLVTAFKKTIKAFMKHPVMLSSHNYRGLTSQIGKFEKIKIDEIAKEVVATAKWFVGLGNPEADWGWVLVENGIAAFSIGFIPKSRKTFSDDEMKENGGVWMEYDDIELLETSQVLIPANPSALQKSFETEDEEPFIKELSQKLFDLYNSTEEVKNKMDTMNIEDDEEEVKLDEFIEEELEEKIQEESIPIDQKTIDDLMIKMDEILSLIKEFIPEKKEVDDEEVEVDIEEKDQENEEKKEEVVPIDEMVGLMGEDKVEELRNCLLNNQKCDINETEEIKKAFDDVMKELQEKFSLS